ncbi:hypothetical protein NECID01_1220 [Nematocida sp. AWRm77]|nr:hypothetical protein NECID01_1220 [Nematocida sp. AWRm77]
MLKEWLSKILSPLEVPVHISTKKIQGVLVGPNKRKEWRFSAQIEATLQDLCTELEKAGQLSSVGTMYSNPKEALLELKDRVYIVASTQAPLLVEIQNITVVPSLSAAESSTSQQRVVLQKIGVRHRLCGVCKQNAGTHKRKTDILIPFKVKTLCTECYKAFHWTAEGEKKYSEFSYTPIE